MGVDLFCGLIIVDKIVNCVLNYSALYDSRHVIVPLVIYNWWLN